MRILWLVVAVVGLGVQCEAFLPWWWFADRDADRLPDRWEQRYGTDPDSVLPTEPCGEIDLRWSGAWMPELRGVLMDVAVSGDYAYGVLDCMGNRVYWPSNTSRFAVFDVSDPSNPVGVSTLDTGGVPGEVAVSGDYAFVADGANGLLVIDVSDPAHPALAAGPGIGTDARAVAVEGDYAYVADGTNGLLIVDVFEPYAPEVSASLAFQDPAMDVAVTAGRAVVLLEGGGLQTVDVADPAAPDPGARITGSFRCLAAADGLFYAVRVGRYPQPDVLTLFDPVDASNPLEIGALAVPKVVSAIAVSNGLACLAETEVGVTVVDVSNPAAPVLAGRRALPEEPEGISAAGDLIYVAGGLGGLRIIDIADIAAPGTAGSVDLPAPLGSLRFEVRGELAYVPLLSSDAGYGLQIVDLSNPDVPSLLGYTATSNSGHHIALDGHHAYLSSHNGFGWTVIDISNPAAPAQVGYLESELHLNGAAIADGYAFVAAVSPSAPKGVLLVLDVHRPAHPREVVALPLNESGHPLEVAIAGHYAFVADIFSRLHVVDISDPTHPAVVTQLRAPSCVDVEVRGNLAVLAARPSLLVDIREPARPRILSRLASPIRDSSDKVEISGDYVVASGSVFDISDPATPVYVGEVAPSGAPASLLRLLEGYACLANTVDGGARLQLVEFQPARFPKAAGAVATAGFAHEVAVSGDVACVADGPGGLRIVDLSDPRAPKLAATVPTIGQAREVEVRKDHAYVLSHEGTLTVADITDPYYPRRTASLPTGLDYGAAGLVLLDRYAYAVNQLSDVAVLDIADPGQPILVNVTRVSVDQVMELDGDGSRLYAPSWRGHGIVAVDITDPIGPETAGRIESIDASGTVLVESGYAYVIHTEHLGMFELQIIDVTDPAAPVLVGAAGQGSGAPGMALDGGYLVTATYEGMEIFDVSDPAAPAYLAALATPGQAYDIARAGAYACVADGAAGLQVIRLFACADYDRDGMDDEWELDRFGDLAQDETTDFDCDGLLDWGEFQAGSDPTAWDSDGDRIGDFAEVWFFVTDPAGGGMQWHPRPPRRGRFAEPPRIGLIYRHNGRPGVEWPGQAGRKYRVMMSTNLVDWFEASSGAGAAHRARRSCAADGTMRYEAPADPDAECVFFRVEEGGGDR